jgi:hypothetical protein
MKIGYHSAYLINFVSDFAEGKISRFFFELDYSGYVIEHFPEMERENKRLANRFANFVDRQYEYAQSHNISDDRFRLLMNNALCDLLGKDKPDIW